MSIQQIHPRLGAIPDTPDERDFPMRALQPLMKVARPRKVSYKQYMGTIKDQGNRGACVAFGNCYIKQYQESLERGRKVRYDFSEEYIYSQIRVPGGGALPREGMKVLVHNGVPLEKYYPYTSTPDNQPIVFNPSRSAKMSARHYKAQGYAGLYSLEEVLSSLHLNGPLGVALFWQNDWFIPNGKILQPKSNQDAGGHWVCIDGYDEDRQILEGVNSWGKDWNGNGRFELSFDAFNRHNFGAWAAFDIKKVNQEALTDLIERKEKLT